jgi:hypothetical protein
MGAVSFCYNGVMKQWFPVLLKFLGMFLFGLAFVAVATWLNVFLTLQSGQSISITIERK